MKTATLTDYPSFRGSFTLAAVLAVLVTASSARAQGTIAAVGTFTDTPNGSGGYNYVINLQNNSASSVIGTFWLGWIPGGFFLPSDPSSVTPPAGWTDTTPTSSGRYSIEFTDNSGTAAIPAGGSLNFGFASVDTPATVAGPSAVAGEPVGESTLYSGNSAFSGSSLQFAVTPAPEPSTIALLVAGSLGLLFASRRKLCPA
jgi:hypothetical protein